MLVLTQPELKGIDPHSKDLDTETKQKIVYECKVNPWYFFREVMRIGASGGDLLHFQLNRANLALIWLFLTDTNLFLTMPRQIGKTIGTLSIVLWSMYVAGENINIGLFAKGNALRQENVDRLKELRNNLPKYMYLAGPAYNTDNQEGLEYKKLHNKYLTFVAIGDKRNSAAMGRGQSHAFQQWDEFGYFTNNKLAYESAKSATNTAGRQVRAKGIPAANIITTTAGNLASPEGMYAYNIRNGCVRYTEKLFDCKNVEELKDLILNNGTSNMVYIEFSYKQLGKDDVWFREVTTGLSQDIIDCDFLNKWSYGGKDSVIPKELLDKLSTFALEPVYNEINNKLLLRWYLPEPIVSSQQFKNTPFIIAADTSDNVGSDFTTIVVINPYDMAVVMTAKCNSVNLTYVSKLLIHLLTRFPRAVLIPERNKNGAIVLDAIIYHFTVDKVDMSFDPFKRLFNTYVQNYSSTTPKLSTLDLNSGTVRKSFGFNTTVGSRESLYGSVLMTTVNRNYMRIFDPTIIDEIKGLTMDSGRVDHSNGNHDDMLVAYLIACWFVMYGRNHNMYGIKSNEILSDIQENSNLSLEERERIKTFKNKIKSIEETLSGNISQMLRFTLTSELEYLKAMIPPDDSIDNDVISLHQIGKEREESNRLLDPLKAFKDDFRFVS